MSPFKNAAHDIADVLLPIAPFTETSGTFVSAEGRVQGFHGVVRPLGDTRPAWKVLRVLGNMLDLEGFDFESSEDVRADALGDAATILPRLNNRSGAAMAASGGVPPAALERVADVPIYATDSLVRRATSLQLTADARAPVASLPQALWDRLGLTATDKVRVSQGAAHAVLPARLDAGLAATAVRVPAGHADTATLGAMFGAITVEKV
jgi:NADH-quinone oxidoreductase subunit G